MFKERLKELRGRNGVSQMGLSKRLNVSQSLVAAWEKGRTEPNLASIGGLSDYFGVTTDYLLGRTDMPITMHTTNTPYMQVTPLEKEIVEKFREQRNLQVAVCRALGVVHPDDQVAKANRA